MKRWAWAFIGVEEPGLLTRTDVAMSDATWRRVDRRHYADVEGLHAVNSGEMVVASHVFRERSWAL